MIDGRGGEVVDTIRQVRAAIVAVTYPTAIIVGIVLGLWVAGLQEVQCPQGLSTGNCFLGPRQSPWEAGLIGLACAAAVLASGITLDRWVGRRRPE
jgi:hypothetical protein